MRRLMMLAALAAVTCLQGCILLTADIHVNAPDPLAAQYVAGKAVAGRTVTFSNGKEVDLAGIDVESLDAEQRAAFEAAFAKWVVGNKELLILDEHDKTAVVAGTAREQLPWEGIPAIILFPRHIKVPPGRIDVGSQLISSGLAKVRESEVTDPARLDQYVRSQAYARNGRVGVWMGDAERLCDAAGKGDLDKVRGLLAKGVSVNAVGFTLGAATTPLISAAANGRDEAVRFLITNGADVNATDGQHHTASEVAARSRADKVLLALIDAGVPVAEQYWQSLLYIAAARGDTELVRKLLEAAEKTGYKAFDPPLQAAAKEGKLAVAKLLVEHGANVNSADGDGVTPLMLAASRGDEAVVEFLLAGGADPNARDKHDLTVLSHARQSRKRQVVTILEKAGAHK